MPNQRINLADKETMRLLRFDISDALHDIAAKYGISFELGTLNYKPDGTHVHGTLNINVGDAQEARRHAFDKIAARAGFAPGDFECLVTIPGDKTTYKLTKLEAKRGGSFVATISSTTTQKDYRTAASNLVKTSSSPAPKKETDVTEHLAIANKLVDEIAQLQTGAFSMEKHNKGRQILDELTRHCEQATGLIANILQFPVADGCALYLITGTAKGFVEVRHIDYGDGYTYSGVIGGRIDIRVAEKQIRAYKSLGKAFTPVTAA
jgi:hypothetical protein